ncbi:MAG: TonB-dependent receptor, partial [Edaphobacter sp.]
VAPETVRSYEAGVKSSLFSDRVQLNADYYRNDYKALQLTAVLPTGEFTLTNATGALIQGVEMDARIQLTRQWNANAGFGTIDAKYKNYSEINNATFSGVDLKHAPRFQWYLSSTYIQPLASADLVWSMRLKYTDTYFTNQDNNHIAKPPTHLDAGARISYEPRNKNWSVALWGQNLTNNRIPTDGFDIKGLGVQIVYPTLPRTYGMEFNYRFF